MTDSSDVFKTDPSLRFLSGDGEMRTRIRQFDWSKTALGHPARWPPSLKTALAIMLDNAAPSYLAWGPDYIQLYNDAYISALGPRKHPEALGNTSAQTWWEIWDFVGPLFDRVRTSGKPVAMENAMFAMRRAGYLEECYFNFTYSPLADSSATIMAVFVVAWETTYEVITTRRSNAIRALVQGLSAAGSLKCIKGVFKKICLEFSQDIPFGLWYDVRPGRTGLDLAVAAGMARGSALSPELLDPLRDALYAGLVDLDAPVAGSRSFPEELTGSAAARPPGTNPRCLFIKPLCFTNVQRPDAYIVLAVNPLRPNDDAQRDFFQAMRFHLERAVGRVSRHELERREREHHFASVMSVLPCMVWTTDTGKRATFFNQTWLDFRGRSLGQEVGGGWEQGLHPDDAGLLGQFRREADQCTVVSVELRILRADGQYRWVFCEATPRLTVSGEFSGYIGTCFDVTERKQTERNIRASQDELRKLYDLLQTTRDEERRALAREVHDQLGQILSAAKIDVALLEQDFAEAKGALSRSEILAELRSARGMMEKSIDVVRQLATDLRPPELESQGLAAAIEWHARDFERRTKIGCELELQAGLHDLDERTAAALFRIFQEAMTNVLRHAKASRVRISLERTSRHVRLRVRDNGVGIEHARRVQSNGLKGMRERTAIAGGRLVVGAVGNSGTLVAVRLPLIR